MPQLQTAFTRVTVQIDPLRCSMFFTAFYQFYQFVLFRSAPTRDSSSHSDLDD